MSPSSGKAALQSASYALFGERSSCVWRATVFVTMRRRAAISLACVPCLFYSSCIRYKAWRAADGLTHVLCRFGSGNDPATDPFERLPERIRHMGPWNGSHEGDVSNLRTRYRLALMTEGFCVVYRKVTAFHPEVDTRRYVPAQR